MNDTLQQIVAVAPVALVRLDREGRFVFAAGRLLTELGVEPKALIGAFAADLYSSLRFFDGDGAPIETHRFLADLLRRGEPTTSTAQLGDRWLETRYEPIRDDQGALTGFFSVTTDVTERRMLRTERNRFFTMTRDLLCIATMDGYFKMINPAFNQTLGYSTEELTRRRFLDLVHPDDLDATLSEMDKLRAGATTIDFENRYIDRFGQVHWLSWTSVPDVELGLLYASARDITDVRALHEQFLQAQKMEAIGRLAGGVAHDFNNLLTVILGGTSVALETLAPDHPARSELADVHTAAEQAAALTSQLLAFSRKQMMQPRLIDLNRQLAERQTIMRRVIGEDVVFSLALEDNLPNVEIDPTQLDQAVLNLVVNARDAMPDGGTLTIATARVLLDEESARTAGAPAGTYAVVEVRDSGCGMDAATRARIFEPFFTTKPAGRGTGLGLSTVFGIVRQSAGFIRVDSAPERGTSFKLHFPATAASVPLADGQPTTAAAVGRGERVLVVEDAEAVRSFFRRTLERYGFVVREASNGVEALAIVGDTHERIDLLLTDVIMPRMNGRALAEQARKLRPSLPVVYVTGYTDDLIVRDAAHAPGFDYLEKPVNAATLLTKVRAVLDRES